MTNQVPGKSKVDPSAIPDLLSFDSWEGSENLAMSSATVSSTASSVADESDSNIAVSISGVIFSLDPTTFDKLRRLPWQVEERAERDDAGAVSYSLSTSPELFDALLHNILFGALPHAMSEHDMEELEIMALSLGLTDLANHLSVTQPLLQPRRKLLDKQGSFSKSSKTASLRSWAAVKRWSSTGKLAVKNKIMEKKLKRSASQRIDTHVSSATTDLV